MLFVKCDAFSRASNLLVVCGCLFCEVVFQGLLVVCLVGAAALRQVGCFSWGFWIFCARLVFRSCHWSACSGSCFLSTVCWQVEPLICLLCVAALCVFAVCFCFGLATNPLDCFLIVFCFFVFARLDVFRRLLVCLVGLMLS